MMAKVLLKVMILPLIVLGTSSPMITNWAVKPVPIPKIAMVRHMYDTILSFGVQNSTIPLNKTDMSRLIVKVVYELVFEIRTPHMPLAVISAVLRIIPLMKIFPLRLVTLSIVSQYPLLTPAAIKSIIPI